ncbi:hypothetical protein RB195_023233 [Necator americanus]|uniref:Uncharacterized protein n=1 Tax=Necator americanus TaxID=51031 RepID=A0ABR1EIM3_NECAM
MGLELQSDVLERWYYPSERTWDNGDRLVDLCEHMGLIIASTFKKNRRRHQLKWQGSTILTPEEQRKRKKRTLKLQLDYVLTKNIPQLDIQKSGAVWDVAFDSFHRPFVLSIKIRDHKRKRDVPHQPKIDMAGLKAEECRISANVCLFMSEHGPGKSFTMWILLRIASRTLQRKHSRFTGTSLSIAHVRLSLNLGMLKRSFN